MVSWLDLIQDRIKAPIGHEFYVGGAGAGDDKSGRVAEEPFLKIATALEHCKSGRHDVIWVQDYWANDTFPIVLNKQCVHILGLSTPGVNSHWPIMNATNAAVFQIGSHSYCEIAGLSMGASGGYPCIAVVGGETRIWLHHLALGEHLAAQDGILCDSGGDELAFSTVEHCLFGKTLSRDGIRAIDGTLTNSFIRNNIFRKYGGVGINFLSLSSGIAGGFFSNRFFKEIGGAKGWAITITRAQQTMVDDNHAMESAVAPQNNPYKDTSTGVPGTTKNGWGVNWSGAVTVMPDVA